MLKAIIFGALTMLIWDFCHSQVHNFDSFEDLMIKSHNGQSWNYEKNSLDEFKIKFPFIDNDTTLIDQLNNDIITVLQYSQNRFTFCN